MASSGGEEPVRRGLSKYFNETLEGRANVAKVTLLGLAVFFLVYKFKPKKVKQPTEVEKKTTQPAETAKNTTPPAEAGKKTTTPAEAGKKTTPQAEAEKKTTQPGELDKKT